MILLPYALTRKTIPFLSHVTLSLGSSRYTLELSTQGVHRIVLSRATPLKNNDLSYTQVLQGRVDPVYSSERYLWMLLCEERDGSSLADSLLTNIHVPRGDQLIGSASSLSPSLMLMSVEEHVT